MESVEQRAAQRLREALAAVGVMLPDGGLLELAVRASRVIRDHADDIQASDYRRTHRALPSGDLADPWRVGASVVIYTRKSYRDDYRQTDHAVITEREDRGGSERYKLGARSVYAHREQNAPYATHGAWSGSFIFPVGMSVDEIGEVIRSKARTSP